MTIITYPERVQTWLDRPNPASKRLPFSCTLGVLKATSQVSEIMKFAITSLKAGAGVKIIIDQTFCLPEPKEIDVIFLVDPDHPDWAQYSPDASYAILKEEVEGYYQITVEDTLESIIGSLIGLENAINNRYSAIQINLSALRPRDSINSDGLVASGPMLFVQIYAALARYLKTGTMHSLLRLLGVLNEVILRGGTKKGIITSAIHCDSPYLKDYLTIPLVSLQGSHKKGVILTKQFVSSGMNGLGPVIWEKVNSESLFLQKDHSQPGLYANVCQGIYLQDRGTCLIVRINLGQITQLEELSSAFKQATQEAIHFMVEWRKNASNAHMWAAIENDRQVAIDVMGLANLLRNFKVSYQDFIQDLESPSPSSPLVLALRKAYQESVKEADQTCLSLGLPSLERLHSVEPAQTHSYRSQDTEGYTVCRGIWAPFTRIVNRMSNRETIQTYDHGSVETHISPDLHLRLCSAWLKMMQDYGRPHAISYDTWVDFNETEFTKWYNSHLTTLYYNMSSTYNDDYSRKSITPVSLISDPDSDCSVCAY